jgi:hypothetical protein
MHRPAVGSMLATLIKSSRWTTALLMTNRKPPWLVRKLLPASLGSWLLKDRWQEAAPPGASGPYPLLTHKPGTWQSWP